MIRTVMIVIVMIVIVMIMDGAADPCRGWCRGPVHDSGDRGQPDLRGRLLSRPLDRFQHSVGPVLDQPGGGLHQPTSLPSSQLRDPVRQHPQRGQRFGVRLDREPPFSPVDAGTDLRRDFRPDTGGPRRALHNASLTST